jgi:SpoIID/LytB domain protein
MNDGSIRGWPKPWRKILLEGRLIDLKVGSVSQARIHSVVSVWNWSGRNLELSIPAPQFRKWMGPGRLKSTSFQVSPGFEKGVAVFHITGRGNGHGVGMCQLGAKFMGEKGFQTANILKHYYPDALLKKLW